jgi:hypothetical protein
VRKAIRQLDGKDVFLDARAVVGADIGIVRWTNPVRSWQTPVVSMVGPGAKTETPMRYTLHKCP